MTSSTQGNNFTAALQSSPSKRYSSKVKKNEVLQYSTTFVSKEGRQKINSTVLNSAPLLVWD
jgi:hypothetical protein